MGSDLEVVQRLLNAIDAARRELSVVRRPLWNASQTSTKEHIELVRVQTNDRGWTTNSSGETVVISLFIVTTLKDHRALTSYVEVLTTPQGWLVNPYIAVLNEGEDVVWQGQEVEGSTLEGLETSLLSAARATAHATLEIDLDNVAAE